MTGALGFHFLTNLVTLNEDISGSAAIEYVLNDVLALGIGRDPIEFLGMVTNPTRAYLVATVGAFPAELTEATALPTTAERSWYVHPEIAVAVLRLWLLLPVVVGIRRFERSDLS